MTAPDTPAPPAGDHAATRTIPRGPPLRWTALGDAAVAIRFDGPANSRGVAPSAAAGHAGGGADRLLDRVHAAVARLDADPLPGVDDVVATFTTVTLFFDPARWSCATLAAAAIARLADGAAGAGRCARSAARVVEIPVVYGGDDGPDLDDVAGRTGLPAAEVVRLHAAADYRVAMVGFAPGFPYLVGLPAPLAVPRLDVPRLRVAAGSVGIGGGQTGVYPLATPGGWRIIGRTPLALFCPERDPPVILAAGDVVRFRSVAATAFAGREDRVP